MTSDAKKKDVPRWARIAISVVAVLLLGPFVLGFLVAVALIMGPFLLIGFAEDAVGVHGDPEGRPHQREHGRSPRGWAVPVYP